MILESKLIYKMLMVYSNQWILIKVAL
jgi:hypothetical protein